MSGFLHPNVSYTLVVPTYNGGGLWRRCIASILMQSSVPNKVVVIDSSSKDDTRDQALAAGFDVHRIEQSCFDHGGTRSLALRYVDTELVVFLTQDAILADCNAIERLMSVFAEAEIGAVYGRQLPHVDANPLAAYARQHSYSKLSYITSLQDSEPQGFRKAFMSNSFAAYRVKHLQRVGSFPNKLILGEDSYVAARMLQAGFKVAYQAEAHAFHSHNYSVLQEFQRYFDIGVFHQCEKWMLDELGKVEGQGVRFALGQLKGLWQSGQYSWLFASFMASAAKYMGYKLGWFFKRLPLSVCCRLSMYKSYWR